MSCVRSPQADSDLDTIWFYIATQSDSANVADQLIDSIVERFLLLANYPHSGRRRERELGAGLRSFPVGQYVIFYRVEGEDVRILRVLHGRRDIEALLEP